MASKIVDDNKIYNLAINAMKLSLSSLREVISPAFYYVISRLCCLAKRFYEYTNDKYFYEMYMKLLEYIRFI